MEKIVLAICTVLMASTISMAAPVSPTSYDMPNGYTGSYEYWDESYNGAGNTTVSGAALSGGLGDLTDGVIATGNWYVVEQPQGPGPYVGWSNIDPEIIFHFAGNTVFDSVTIYFDDANGAGGVSAPTGVTINGTYFSVNDPTGSDPFSVSFTLGNLTTDTLSIVLARGNQWVFASEFTFASAGTCPVPEPTTVLLFGAGLSGLAAVGRRKLW
nr:PEP-CTERM sorting domain-containing protein [uncultured Desulfobulbus sp.]